MNFLRCRTVACAEQRIHLRFRPRSLLLLHSRQMLTWWWEDKTLKEGTDYSCHARFVLLNKVNEKFHAD